ncbi:LytR C-terminal domain-containing protein [Tsukamurella soli]|uniref:LytR C-terminal domain-containing protein n=1 Tax=Tsukamurella soli TaxID=644556 RepID=UPI0031EA246A
MSTTDHQRKVPIRAIIMILVALAIAFAGLGWHAVATRDSDPDSALHAQAAKLSATAPAAPSGASESAAPSSAPAAAPAACVYSEEGASAAARAAVAEIKKAGVTVRGEVATWKGKAPRATVVYYGAGQENAAGRVAAAIDHGSSAAPRPAGAEQCAEGLVVVVVK